MFKILGLLCLSTAYSLSVLYMDGIKLGDLQVRVAAAAVPCAPNPLPVGKVCLPRYFRGDASAQGPKVAGSVSTQQRHLAVTPGCCSTLRAVVAWAA